MRLHTSRSFGSTLAVLVLTAAACSGGSSPTATTETSTASTPHANAIDRLVVIDDDGELWTMAPDGSDRMALTEDAPDRLRFIQPTWSPDGSRIAWTEIDGRGPGVTASLVTRSVAGDDVSRAEVPFVPFYLYWNPTATRLAYLGQGSSQLELGIVDVSAGGTEAGTIDTGQPFYFAWAPQGDRMVVHVGAGRLDLVDLDGNVTDLGPAPAAFQAPAWSRDGSRIAYAARDGDVQYIAVADADGGNERRLVEYAGFVTFVLSPDGSRIAYQAFGEPGSDQSVVAFGPGLLAAAPLAQDGGGGLSVVDIETGGITTVSVASVLAFFWSPQGDRLAALGLDAGGGPRVHWRIWDEAGSFTTEPFRPSATMLQDYLPFFDQFAKSIAFWSPDGTAIAYAGTDTAGESGIWVQPARQGASPVKVGDGRFVAWSPR